MVKTKNGTRYPEKLRAKAVRMDLDHESAYASRSAGLCCTNGVRDSLFESRMIAGRHEQLVPYEVQDQELVDLQ